MRLHKLETPKVSSNYVQEDLEYIDDSIRILGRVIFEQVCQIDDYTERAMVGAAVAGYLKKQFGDIVSHPSPQQCKPVPNKGFVALWIECHSTTEYVFGLYRHDSQVYLYKVSVRDLKEYVDRLDMVIDSPRHQRLYAMFASFGPEYFRKG